MAIRADGVVILDQFTLEDIDAQVCGEDDEHARRFGWFPERSTHATVREAIDRWTESWTSGGPVHAFVIRRVGDAVSVGGVELRRRDEASAEVSYWTYRDHRGHGYATRALRLLCDYAGGELGIRRLEAHIEPDNIASLGVARSAGFRRTGTISERTELGEERTMLRLTLSRIPGHARPAGGRWGDEPPAGLAFRNPRLPPLTTIVTGA